MSTSPRRTTTRERARTETPAGPAFPVIEGKLSVPPARPGLVVRRQLIDRLRGARDIRVVAVMAPSGYGKTTLLAQWAAADERPVVWLTVDEQDDDPSTLLTYIAVGLDGIRPVDPEIFAALSSPRPAILSAVVPRLEAVLQEIDPAILLVLDDVHLLTEPVCLDALDMLASHLPSGSQLAFGCRANPALRLPQLRAQGWLLDIGPAELAFEHDDAVALLRASGARLPDPEVEEIVARTEGWAAGLYLAALSFTAGSGVGTSDSFSGRDRFVVDYLRAEILEQMSARDLRFLTRTSVLDRMCGPLCDAVTATKGAGGTLDRLEEANLFLVPLDRRREWYRYHALFRDVLRAELEKREPEIEPLLLGRAADWHKDNGMPEIAVEYAMDADDHERAAHLVERIAQPMYRTGRVLTLQRWFEWFEARGLVSSHAPLAVLGSWIRSVTGDAAGAARWAEIAEGASLKGRPPDGSRSMTTWTSVLRALRCVDGVARMRADAERAVRETPLTSFWHPTALALLGMAEVLGGDETSGGMRFAEALEIAEQVGFHPNACFCLSQLAALAIARGEWAEAESLVSRAHRLIDQARLEGYWTSALAYAVAARIAIRAVDRRAADEHLARAQRLRSVLSHAIPWSSVQVRAELIRALVAHADPAGARTLLREIDDIAQRFPDLGVLNDQVEELRRHVRALPAGTAGASSLTPAELRLIPYLHTHLTFPEIAKRLFLSPNTVKTQAISLYRKLGVSSRGEAMSRAEELGLIER